MCASSRRRWASHGGATPLLADHFGVGTLVTGAAGKDQTNAPAPLLCTHVFEHTFGYAIVPLVAAGTFLALGRSAPG